MPPRHIPVMDQFRTTVNRSWARKLLWAVGGLLLAGSVGILAWFGGPLKSWVNRVVGPSVVESGLEASNRENSYSPQLAHAVPASLESDNRVHLALDQQKAIGLRTESASPGSMHEVLRAPGQVVPDQTRYAFITPRAAGVVRSVAAHIGQDVKAGDLLATIDSAEVAQARLDLVTQLQEQEIARTQAEWQTEIYQATLALLERLKSEDSPTQIQEEFENRAVGENRALLMTAYAKYRLADAMRKRSEHLREGDAVSVENYQRALAEYEAAMASYKSLMDRVGFEARLQYARAQQVRKRSETMVRVARERLRVLGVRSDGMEVEVRGGKVVGVKPDGTLPDPAEEAVEPTSDVNPEEILPKDAQAEKGPGKPVGLQASKDLESLERSPISTYALWAPFDGTIIDRQLVVPGVSVDITHRIYQLADLSTVWIEVKIQEMDYDELISNKGARIQFTSPAYANRVFEGKVIYTGDLVEEKTRSIQLLAEASNPDRLLKPGMWVDVEVINPEKTHAVYVPRSALLHEEDEQFVYVRVGPEVFERRTVRLGTQDGDRTAVVEGLEGGEEVVTRGAFKLKAAEIGPEGEGEVARAR